MIVWQITILKIYWLLVDPKKINPTIIYAFLGTLIANVILTYVSSSYEI